MSKEGDSKTIIGLSLMGISLPLPTESARRYIHELQRENDEGYQTTTKPLPSQEEIIFNPNHLLEGQPKLNIDSL